MKIERVLAAIATAALVAWLLLFGYNVFVCHNSGGVSVPGFLGSVVCIRKEFLE